MKYLITERQLDLLLEKREGWYKLLQKKLPHFPEYVLKDFIYRKVDEYKDYESFNNYSKAISDFSKYYKLIPIIRLHYIC